jgi:hypothetical protein
MHREQNEMNDQADQFKREIEAVKLQNSQLLNENNDYKHREGQIEAMLERERKRVDELEEEVRRERAAH